MKKVSLSQAYAGINRQFLALQVENEQLKARIKELEAQVASQQSVRPTGGGLCAICNTPKGEHRKIITHGYKDPATSG